MKKYKSTIISSSIVVTLFTIFIKVLGIVKHSVIASKIGATIQTDAFYIATGVIGQLAITIFSALSVTLLTFYTDKKEQESKKTANDLINSALIFFVPIACMISIVFFTFAPYISKLLAPSYMGESLKLLTRYVRVMSFAFIPCCYNIILNVILENEKIFTPGRSRGFFQNLFVILAVLLLFNSFEMISVVYAFLGASLIQSIVITICSTKYFKFNIPKNKCFYEIKQIFMVSIPLIIGNTVYEINDIVDKQIATNIGEGSASILTYGATLNEIVTGVIVASISVVLFANFATWISKKEFDKIENSFIVVMNALIMIIVPIFVMCLVSGKEIVTLFYGHGQLSNDKLDDINMVLIGYAVGFVFQAFRANLIKILYAFKDTKATMINGIISIVFNIILSVILSKMIGIWGISLATSLAIFVATLLLYISVKKYLPDLSIVKIIDGYHKYIFAGLLSYVLVYLLHSFICFNYFINLCIEGFVCLIIYILVLIMLKSNGINYLIKKTRII
ncbi:MAG: putative membrane protein, putative virulence factor [bacterium F083]|nr:MAG: putative membrane protein, putative virulence factor [bacterium F083]